MKYRKVNKSRKTRRTKNSKRISADQTTASYFESLYYFYNYIYNNFYI
jgi:hypothetical protein